MNDSGQKPPAFPWKLLALDLVGSVLAAWGIYKYVGGEGGMTYIIVGFTLMLPFGLHIINRAQGLGRRRHDLPKDQ